ncbi:MAG: hypothetical protein ABSG55_09630 [Dehalococcoidia bacterium]|jgi:hypothetical protein
MSKLGDRIRKTMRTEAAPIGFRAVRPAKTPQLLTALLLEDADGVAQAVAAGAGAVILKDAKLEDVETAVKAADETPLGVWPKRIDAADTEALIAASADFVVFEAESTPATALLEEKLGYVLALKDGADDDTYLRVLESVALDAILLPDWKGPLTLKKQLELRRIAALARKPLLLPVELSVESGDLECLRDAGVSVLLLDGDMDALPALIKTIEELPGPRRHRETTLEVLLPRAAEMAAEEEGEEEEEEDE